VISILGKEAESASTNILKKGGFKFIGIVEDPEDGQVWEWELDKKSYDNQPDLYFYNYNKYFVRKRRELYQKPVVTIDKPNPPIN